MRALGLPATAAVLAPALLLAAALAQARHAPDDRALPERVTFSSKDGRTTLVGYVYTPGKSGRVPAVVMMHGRAGAYSSAAKGRYDASTLSQRHQMWGRNWAARGYVAVLVDGFGPRGHPQGFPRHSYEDRPQSFNEVTVRPLDAYGALAYLRTRADVLADRIALQGWSNGASAALATMASDAPGIVEHTPAAGFRAALAFYPGCGLHDRFNDGLKPYASVRVLHGTGDKEVSAKRCANLVFKSRALGADIDITLYPGATHDFDNPDRRRQRRAANVIAKADAMARATQFLAAQFADRQAHQ
jgi:carboxymethylenebutenolidase